LFKNKFESKKSFMKKILATIFSLIMIFLVSCQYQVGTDNQEIEWRTTLKPSPQEQEIDMEDDSFLEQTLSEDVGTNDQSSIITPTLTPTPDPFIEFYGCEMQIDFLNGPLESEKVTFSVIEEDYFDDKGDQFLPGKGTGVYYDENHYFILHSAYLNGNIFKPMEVEFIRKYLENWGEKGPEYIQNQIDQLLGSDATWICEGQSNYLTRIDGVVRLSHEASDRLWLEPRNIDAILADREGLAYEWVGGLEEKNDPVLILGFCGWGPESLGDARFTYYRYLISFQVLD
jgi:hypothetical protein